MCVFIVVFKAYTIINIYAMLQLCFTVSMIRMQGYYMHVFAFVGALLIFVVYLKHIVCVLC